MRKIFLTAGLLSLLLASCGPSENTDNLENASRSGAQSDHAHSPSQFQMKKVSQPMPIENYWRIIEMSLDATEDIYAQEKYLIQKLTEFSPEEIAAFYLRTQQLSQAAYSGDLWCAAYIINGGCSDDCFTYFGYWVISRGQTVYERSVARPDDLALFLKSEPEETEFEAYAYVPMEAFEAKTGNDLMEFIDFDAFQRIAGPLPEINFSWNEDEPATLQAICPRLFERFW